MTYIEKKTNNEIISMLIKRMIKITQDELKMVPDDFFRKIRQGREHTPPSKPTKKYGRSKYTVGVNYVVPLRFSWSLFAKNKYVSKVQKENNNNNKL